MLSEKIINLKKRLIEYGSLVEDMLDKSIKGLVNKDKNLLLEVIQKDECKANEIEIELDNVCITMIVQFQPTAKDLRTIVMILKMNNDLERMADHTVNIAESALFLIERPPVKPYKDIPKISELTASMLKDSINSFVNEDAVLAKKVCERDNFVDDLKKNIVKELTEIMTNDSSTVERSIHLLRITNNLERIADLSTNIGEDVLYMVKGKVIKHHISDRDDNVC